MNIPLRRKYLVYNGDVVVDGKVKKSHPQYGVARRHDGSGRRGPMPPVRPPDRVIQPPAKVMLVNGLTGAHVMIKDPAL